MKKSILLFVALVFVGTNIEAQVISNFNNQANGVSGFEKAGDSDGPSSNPTGPGLDSLFWTHDPSNSANGVLAMAIHWDSTGQHGRMELGSGGNATYIAPNGAKFVTFWVYVDSAQNVPDSMQIDTYAMDNTNWSWTEDVHFVKDIPHNVWYPLSFPLAAHKAQNPNFQYDNPAAGKGFMTGLQVFPHNANSVGWHGFIYVDNVSLVGALPHYIADSTGASGYEKAGDSDGPSSNPTGPGLDSVYQATSPTNSANKVLGMAIHWDSTGQHGRMELGSGGNAAYFPGGVAQFVTFWVYVDSAQNVPDSMQIDTYAMDNTNWSWTEDVHFVKDIPHNVWYPLSFPLAAHKAQNPNFQYDNPAAGKGFMTGLQVFPHDTNSVGWHGIIYVKGAFLSDTIVAVPPPVWVAADFENPGKNGKQGFYVPSYASGTIKRYADLTTSNQSYVLQGTLNISKSTPIFAVVRDSIPMKDPADSTALSVSFGLYVPTKFPKNALVKFFVSGGPNDSIAVVDTVGPQVKVGQWNTLTIKKLDSLASAGKFDPTKPAQIGVVIWYPSPYDTTTFSGNIEFDNLTITGIWFPNEILDGLKGPFVANEYKLYNNYPNPFNPSTTIQYNLAKNSRVLIQVYDVLGRLVTTLVDEEESAGMHLVRFDASKFASGVYFCRMKAGNYVSTQRMMLVK
jgi:hypothetical protein